jgi:gamma-D-glutamyl-L-lysine dipeptidyl-peptidase
MAAAFVFIHLCRMYGVCHLSAVPCRRESSDRSEMVTQLLFGDAFEVVEQRESWHRIITAWDHYECWIDRKQYLPVSKATFDNLRRNPAPVTTDLITIITDTETQISFPVTLGSSLPYYHSGQCQIEDRVFLVDGNIKPFEQDAVPDRQALVETALLFMNAPYLWGGRTPLGIDCSGFVQLIFKANSMQLKRDAYQQVEPGLAHSFVEEAQAGDLAFFDNEEGRIIHVGMVIDQNKIIHASGRVRIDPFDHYGIFTPERGGYTHNLRIIKNILG